jgi:hypothetical protein
MFMRGVVVVNPTGHTVRVSFGKARYSGSKLRRVTHVRLAPVSAAILLKAR